MARKRKRYHSQVVQDKTDQIISVRLSAEQHQLLLALIQEKGIIGPSPFKTLLLDYLNEQEVQEQELPPPSREVTVGKCSSCGQARVLNFDYPPALAWLQQRFEEKEGTVCVKCRKKAVVLR